MQMFSQELEKAIADKDSSLRLWLNTIFATKSDLKVCQSIPHN